MSVSRRIGIIGGAGWLGGAISSAILGAGLVEPQNLSLSYRRKKAQSFPGSLWTRDSQEAADRSDVIIVCVRPEDWPALSVDAGGKLIISVMAGVRLAELCESHNTERAIRALPNAAAEVLRSYTPWTASSGADEDDRATAKAIFNACGVQDEVTNERDIDYLTGLTGSGPAFPALLAAAMLDDAVSHGLAHDVAKRAVLTMLTGTGRLLEKREDCPNDIVRTFLDYRGTTAAAIEEMRRSGFDAAVRNGLAAAFRKSVSMGETS